MVLMRSLMVFGLGLVAGLGPVLANSDLAGHTADYVVRAAPVEEVERDPPVLPDLGEYSASAVAMRIDREKRGRVRYRRMIEMIELSEFTGSDERIVEWARRQHQNPRVIVIEGGYVTPSDIAEAMPKAHFESLGEGVFIARMPLFVAQGATLHIGGESSKELRLSEEGGAFLANDGQLFITGSKLLGWRESEKGPAEFRDGKKFRPFLLAWGGTETYISGSIVSHLGYAASKSYGISISQYSPGMVDRMGRKPPMAWLIDSEFVDNWYGFYCYEADDLVIARNVYRDNIVYGIDPHDRSHGLIIARNEVFGTKKKHGIIVSREVNDSWIFGNRSHHNKLSGFVLDRSSVRNVVANNTAFANGSDGYTIYESPDNLLWDNHAVGNKRHGIRVRNSVRIKLYGNRAIANGSSGVYGHIKDLRGTDRDLRLDPFDPNVSLVVVGGQLINNDSGPVAIDSPLSLELYDVELLAPTRSSGLQLRGILGRFQDEVLDLLIRQRLPVVIEPAGGQGRGT